MPAVKRIQLISAAMFFASIFVFVFSPPLHSQDQAPTKTHSSSAEPAKSTCTERSRSWSSFWWSIKCGRTTSRNFSNNGLAV